MKFGQPSYAIVRRLPPQTNLAQARAALEASLAEQGFGVLTEIDVAATLKKKVDVDIDPYVILGACNPKLAHQALQAEPGVGVLLPCNVVIARDDDGVVIAAIDPRAMFGMLALQGEPVDQLAAEARRRLAAALENVEVHR